MSDADKRQLTIKAGVVKRVRTELRMYQGEAEQEQARVQKLRDEGADPTDVKFAVRGRDGALPIGQAALPGGAAGAAAPPRAPAALGGELVRQREAL